MMTFYYTKIILFGKKISADIRKEFNSEPVYNKNILKTKIKSHVDEVADFNNKKIAKVDSNHTFLAGV